MSMQDDEDLDYGFSSPPTTLSELEGRVDDLESQLDDIQGAWVDQRSGCLGFLVFLILVFVVYHHC